MARHCALRYSVRLRRFGFPRRWSRSRRSGLRRSRRSGLRRSPRLSGSLHALQQQRSRLRCSMNQHTDLRARNVLRTRRRARPQRRPKFAIGRARLAVPRVSRFKAITITRQPPSAGLGNEFLTDQLCRRVSACSGLGAAAKPERANARAVRWWLCTRARQRLVLARAVEVSTFVCKIRLALVALHVASGGARAAIRRREHAADGAICNTGLRRRARCAVAIVGRATARAAGPARAAIGPAAIGPAAAARAAGTGVAADSGRQSCSAVRAGQSGLATATQHERGTRCEQPSAVSHVRIGAKAGPINACVFP